MVEGTLLINQPFALRQRNGIPVFTSIKMIESPYHESEIDSIIDKLNNHKKVLGLTTTKFFDVEYKEILKKTPKKSRMKFDYESASLICDEVEEIIRIRIGEFRCL